MSRLLAAFCLSISAPMVSPAEAWEAGMEGTICTLTHREDAVEMRLTYDPAGPLYTITVTGPEPWPDAEGFAMVFTGQRGNTITTRRHVLSQDGRSLSVSDRGFGNVLDGLAFNDTAMGLSGDRAVSVSLDGAAPEVAAFRACGTVPAV